MTESIALDASSAGSETHNFLAGGGEMGARIRAFDWERSALGAPAHWSQGLKTTVRLLLSTGHPMLIWWGPDLIQFYNDSYRGSIGPERHPSALGQPARECWEEIWDVIGPQIDYVLAGRGYTWHQNQLIPITRYGRREDVYWTYSYSPIDDPDAPNGVGGILVVCTETTEAVRAEQRMKAAEARWRALFNQAPGFVCILSGPRHTFEFANPRYFELVGWRDIIGKTIQDAFPEVQRQGFVELLDKVYATGEAYSGVGTPLTIYNPDGAPRSVFVDFVYQPIRDDNGEVNGIFVDGYDVTERVLSTETLREEDRRKDEFLATLAHELRNPLAPIRNVSEILTHAADSKIKSIGQLLVRQVTQLGNLVDDLLDVSRISQGRVELQQEVVDLRSAIAIAIESVQVFLTEKRHELRYTPSDRELYVNGDKTRIVQCVANVLTNASKYTDEGGRIWVTLHDSGERAVIEVKDTGIGIAPEMLPKVFDLFSQASWARDRSRGGLGIGLSVVHRLIKMHGGEISGASEGLGRGSTFSISLPLIEPPAQHFVCTDVTEPFFMLKRVLIVDDNTDAANSLMQLLALKGHETATAYSAREALEQARAFAPDVVLLDIGLPDIDGYEVARILRRNHRVNLLVALTGYGQAEDVQRAREAGFDRHLTKPVALEDLEKVIKEETA